MFSLLDKFGAARAQPATIPSSGQARAARELSFDQLRARITIPLHESTAELAEIDRLRDLGRFYVRQDRWDDLSEAVRAAEAERRSTATGDSHARLLVEGARYDVRPDARNAGMSLAEDIALEQFEAALEDYPDDYVVAATVALAHIDLAWVLRGNALSAPPRSDAEQTASEHFARASELLDQFDPFQHDSPLLASARCALLAAQDRPVDRVSDDFEDLVDLDPGDAGHLRRFGEMLLPRWYGRYETLEAEARRTAARLTDVWGAAGAYVWVYFDALALDHNVRTYVDADMFCDGLADIMVRYPTQPMANRLAAFCAVVMAPSDKLPHVDTRAEAARARIHDAFGWILRNHMRELHPRTWYDANRAYLTAANPADPDTVVNEGAMLAYRAIGLEFAAQMANGTRVEFAKTGISLVQRD